MFQNRENSAFSKALVKKLYFISECNPGESYCYGRCIADSDDDCIADDWVSHHFNFLPV